MQLNTLISTRDRGSFSYPLKCLQPWGLMLLNIIREKVSNQNLNSDSLFHAYNSIKTNNVLEIEFLSAVSPLIKSISSINWLYKKLTNKVFHARSAAVVNYFSRSNVNQASSHLRTTLKVTQELRHEDITNKKKQIISSDSISVVDSEIQNSTKKAKINNKLITRVNFPQACTRLKLLH